MNPHRVRLEPLLSIEVKLAHTDAAIAACYPVLVQLRPEIEQHDFPTRVRRQMAQGYELACVLDAGTPVAVAGFRYLENLAWGRFLYVDDLITDADRRSHGHGSRLFDWLLQEAKRRACAAIHLDSGVQRFDAHRFYLRERMRISSHHFEIRLDAPRA